MKRSQACFPLGNMLDFFFAAGFGDAATICSLIDIWDAVCYNVP